MKACHHNTEISFVSFMNHTYQHLLKIMAFSHITNPSGLYRSHSLILYIHVTPLHHHQNEDWKTGRNKIRVSQVTKQSRRGTSLINTVVVPLSKAFNSFCFSGTAQWSAGQTVVRQLVVCGWWHMTEMEFLSTYYF